MKKVLLVFGIVLVALSIMAPGPPDKAEKLKVNDQDFDLEPFFYPNSEEMYTFGVTIEGIECKYGLATAGEHANFTIGVVISGVEIDSSGTSNPWNTSADVRFMKDPDAIKDADGYIAILAESVSWNGDDDGNGYFVNEVALTLISPSGQSLGETSTVDAGGAKVDMTNSSLIKIDNTGWEYEPEHNAIIVPLLAVADRVDELKSLGYRVAIYVEVLNMDGSGAGFGRGSTDIVKVNDEDWDYVQIEPVYATLESVEWNGDDDGSGIVSGTIKLVDAAGNEVSTTTFENQIVGFVIHPEPETES